MTKTRSMRFRAILSAFLLLAIAVAGVWALRKATPYGLSLRNDSVQYVNGARNLLAGDGYTRTSGAGELKPITTVPPMFSTAIAIVSLSGLEALRSARFLILLFFGLDIILLGYLVFRLTRSQGFALAGALLLATSSVFLANFAWLMSEPLFVFFWLVGFIIFDMYLDNRKPWLLILLGVLCGAAYLTRYIGITLLVTLGFCLLILKAGWKRKLFSLLYLGLPFLPFAAGWMIRNTLQIGNLANRTLLVHLATFEKINFGIDQFWDWLLPDSLSDFYLQNQVGFHNAFYVLFLLSLLGLGYLLAKSLKQSASLNLPQPSASHILPLSLYIFIYLGMTLLSMSFVDASTVLDHRLMIPVYLPLLVLLMAGLDWVFRQKGLVVQIIPVVILLVILGFSISEGLTEVKQLSKDGLGYASQGVRLSPTIQYIKELPPILIYTNKSYMVYIVAGRPAYLAPGPTDPVTQAPRENYQQDLEDMRAAIREKKAILIFFKESGYATDSWFLELTRGLEPIEEFYDGVVYRAPQ